MSLSTSRYRWFKVTALLLGLTQLVGCAASKSFSPSVAEDSEAAELADLFDGGASPSDLAPVADESAAIIETVVEEVPEGALGELLPLPVMEAPLNVYGWSTISGGLLGNKFTGVAESAFKRPVAVAARNGYVYIVDEGLSAVLRYDQASHQLSSVLDLKAAVKGEVADIYVAKDLTFYLTDTNGGRVLRYDRNGRLLQVYRNQFNLAKPVAVNVLDGGDVVVADGYYDHVLRFNSSGLLIAAYGGRGGEVGEFINITTMALGPDGYYVGARVGRKVQVLSMNGQYNYSFEEGKVIFPAAIAVDSSNRSYVADYMDNKIKVFDRGRLVATIGRSGSAPGQFMRVTDLWLDETSLYIVDSLNGRIQVARLVPDSPEGVELGPLVP